VHKREPGLRERKKAETMTAVQHAALDLFDEHGFDAVTIEQIAERAGTSPSTVYRYFGTKEGILVLDGADEPVTTYLLEQLTHRDLYDVLDDYLAVFDEQVGNLDDVARRRMRYYFEVSSVRAAAYLQCDRFGDTVAEALATRRRNPMSRLDAHVLAHSFIFGALAGIEQWYMDGAPGTVMEPVRSAIDLLRPRRPE